MILATLVFAVTIGLWQPAAGLFHIKVPKIHIEKPHIDIHKIADHVNDAVKDVVHDVKKILPSVKATHSGCSCDGKTYDCGCCVDLKVSEIGLDDTVCVNITYLPHDYGIRVECLVDGKIVFSDTISARNPPPICFEIPDMKKLASACIDFNHMDISNHTFSGCVDIEIEVAYLKVVDAKLGCFSIPLKRKMAEVFARYDFENLQAFEDKQREFLNKIQQKRRNK